MLSHTTHNGRFFEKTTTIKRLFCKNDTTKTAFFFKMQEILYETTYLNYYFLCNVLIF